ncbi:hypothetical protein [Cellulomonas bogoriensis]|uniref:hypothetical protein n=1 Tax=Cellulomonas bogoriensis TaxID=301388 RepID=UPI000A997F09|nr:hypothetical protein [Cellulomonas bogoriensis]
MSAALALDLLRRGVPGPVVARRTGVPRELVDALHAELDRLTAPPPGGFPGPPPAACRACPLAPACAPGNGQRCP